MDSQDNSRQLLVEQVQAHLASRVSKTQARQSNYFALAFLRRIPDEDLDSENPGTLAALISGLMKFAARREPGTASIRVFNPREDKDGWTSPHTVVEMVNDDMPFIVDTANLGMAELGLGVHLMVHPVIHVERSATGKARGFYPTSAGKGKPESLIHMHVARQSGAERLAAIESRLSTMMGDVRKAVEDWQAMLARADDAIANMEDWSATCKAEDREESREFLAWIRDDHFLMLGTRDYRLVNESGQVTLDVVEGSGLGLLRESDRTIRSRPIATLADGALNDRTDPLIITKTRARSNVHRGGYMDYIGVLKFDSKGQIVGERRFIGLFTSNAYFRRVKDTPLLRQKVERVLEISKLRVGSHARKSLVHILETLPRDDLLQADVEEIYNISTAVLNLQARQRVRLIVRRERFSRFFSCLVYIPRDRFNTENRQKIQEILKRAFKGEQLDYVVQISESVLARLQVIIRPAPGSDPNPDLRALEQKIVEAVRSWHDELNGILVQKFGEETGQLWGATLGQAFPAAYVEDVRPWVASFDVEKIASLGDFTDLKMSLYKPRKKESGIIRFKLFKRGQPIPLSDVLPMLENLGLHVINERPYRLDLEDGQTIWVQDYDMVYSRGADLALDAVRDSFQEAFEYTWRGITSSDGFNRLILACQIHWRQVKVIRAYCKYLLQTGIPFSLAYMAETLAKHPLLARLLIELFDAQFNPARDDESDYRLELNAKHLARDLENLLTISGYDDKVLTEYTRQIEKTRGRADRNAQVQAIRKTFVRGLNSVRSLDEDRILHVFYTVMLCTLRTNFYQQDEAGLVHEYLSFKLDSSRVPDLPQPRPYREIWVYSSRVEGIHLRMGPIARGGLRWSDRKEDFRTEVLGLMKAQNVKNTMIVPVGAKGGFVPSQLPENAGREAVMEEVVYCYSSFINGILDITDNLDDLEILPPAQVVRKDGDDPYMVVAADKGTSTFSDIANGIALERGFWLGDAFASGGSVGYDHKGMGITAKGAWEGVKRHFRELGTDIQKQAFTVVGIGDMAGDVFGNGMLLSRKIRLQAAFNHLHIFLDPNPDEKSSFRERSRLFALPRSNWTDYDESLISKGGGVFSRQEKVIPLSREVREWLGVDEKQLPPNELIRALLVAEVDLLWNGGIGTYVKSSRESDADVGDLANNPLRVDGRELGCKVVGEGGNLGFTQLGRIEYASAGGRINTDFIDNSAGVDCSDHEVNIKILLDQAIRAGELDQADRNQLLADMTDEVGDLVVRSNYLQTQTISMMEQLSGPRLGAKHRFIATLEAEGMLDRGLEFLPEDDELHDRRNRGEGLTRPELSVLLSYSKIRLYSQLLNSGIPEDSFLSVELARYFPTPLQERFAHLMENHRLKREIIATQVTNSLVNRMGVSFVLRMRDDTGATADEVALCYSVARELYAARDYWARIEALDNKVDAALQTEALLIMWNQLRQVTRWLANLPGHHLDIKAVIERLMPGFERVQKNLSRSLDEDERAWVAEVENRFVDGGVPKRLSRRIATLPLLFPMLDVVETAARQDLDVEQVASVYRGLGESLGLKWLRGQVEELDVAGQWHAHARANLRDELHAHHRRLVDQAIRACGVEGDVTACWIGKNYEDVQRVIDMMDNMRSLRSTDYATVSVAVRSLGQLLSATG
jgi:glutamate dehydrogenase